MAKKIAGSSLSISDTLGGPRPNMREHNIGASKATPRKKFKGQNTVTGVKISDVSSNGRQWVPKGFMKSNPFPAKPGARPRRNG